MQEVGILIRLVLAAIFAAAALAKLADRGGAREAATDFGVPERLAGPLALLLPILELAIAALLIPAPTAVYGAIAATILLCAFSIGIGINVARGRTPECHCFGRLHSAPVGPATLARTLGLAGLAAAATVSALVQSPTSAVGWIGDLGGDAAAYTVAAGALALAALAAYVLLGVLRAHGKLLLRVERLEGALRGAGLEVPGDDPDSPIEVASAAPDFALPRLDGRIVPREELLSASRPLLLVFTAAGCAPCHDLLPELSRWQVESADELTIAVAATGPAADVRSSAGQHELENVLLDDGEVHGAYGSPATPSAVLIAPDGAVAAPLGAGPERIRSLRARAQRQVPSGPSAEPAVGDELPRLELPLLGGGTVDLGEPHGSETVLLFWNPGCGYCRQMRDEVRTWERHAASEMRLIVISSGTEEEARAEGFRAPVALDPSFAASRRLGATGTPMAIRVDRDGRVTSSPVAGRDAVIVLLHGEVTVP